MIKCPICGSSVDNISHREEGESLCFCQKCGLILKRETGACDIIHRNLKVVDYINRNDEDTGVSARSAFTTSGSWLPIPQNDSEESGLLESNEHHSWWTDEHSIIRSFERSKTAKNKSLSREGQF
jgi:hypothetical protein